jgi:hypothetical protein
VVWQGSAGDRRPYADHQSISFPLGRSQPEVEITPTLCAVTSVIPGYLKVRGRSDKTGRLELNVPKHDYMERSKRNLRAVTDGTLSHRRGYWQKGGLDPFYRTLQNVGASAYTSAWKFCATWLPFADNKTIR